MTATNSSGSTALHPQAREALQARVARRLIAPLSSSSLPHDIEQRLRFARERALAEARLARNQAAQARQWVRSGAALALAGPAWWQRAASVLPLFVLLAGLVFIQQMKSEVQIDAAAEIDLVLLSDELPPDAYSDPGFGEFLRRPPE